LSYEFRDELTPAQIRKKTLSAVLTFHPNCQLLSGKFVGTSNPSTCASATVAAEIKDFQSDLNSVTIKAVTLCYHVCLHAACYKLRAQRGADGNKVERGYLNGVIAWDI
jgi:hypothetical protein